MRKNQNLYRCLRAQFPEDSKRPFLTTEDERSVSYRDLDMHSAQLAHALTRLGVRPGDRVTVLVEKTVESVFLYLACLRAGFVYHPLNPGYTESEVLYFLSNAEPKAVICAPGRLEEMKRAGSSAGVALFLTLDEFGSGSLMQEVDAEDTVFDPVHREGSDLAALLYSSGTTGKPKGIMLTHENLRKNAETLVEAWGFSDSDRLLHMLPIYHVHGLFVALHCVLMSGAQMAWRSRFDASSAIRALRACTVFMGVPTYYTRLLGDQEFTHACCSSMRLFISGSAPLLSETFYEFKERSGHTILERYGMTETGMNTSNPLRGERRPGTVGPPLPGVEVRVVDPQGKAVPVGETGDLQVRGGNVFAGYWGMPERTAEDFTTDSFFNTGDQALIDANGYVSIVGRAKDMIITGGLNVYPKEIESVIDEMSSVAESAVIGLPDPDFGEKVVAVIVPVGVGPSPGSVMDHCRSVLAKFKVPKKIEFVDALPRNAMGKVQKNALRIQYDED